MRGSKPDDENLGAALLKPQRAYWSSAPNEKEDLYEKIDSLDWGKLLRLRGGRHFIFL